MLEKQASSVESNPDKTPTFASPKNAENQGLWTEESNRFGRSNRHTVVGPYQAFRPISSTELSKRDLSQ